jgi:hypothetical protein
VVDVAALQRENAELRGQVSQLVHQLAKLNERVAELLAIAQRKQRKTPAVKPPAPSPTVEGDAKLAFDERPQAPEKPDEEEKAKSPVKPTGRKSNRCMNPLSSGAEGRLTLGSCFRRPARRAQARSSAGDSSPGRRRAVGSGTVIQPASAASSAASSRARVWFQKSGASSR